MTQTSTPDVRRASEHGFSLIELMIVVGLSVVIAAIAVPMMSNTVGDYRLKGDARAITSAVSLAKLTASSNFNNARLYVDLSSNSFHVESYDKTSSTWVMQPGNTTLSGSDTFGFGAVSSAPPNTQATIGQAPECLTAGGAAIANTACIVFNSRGIPVDSTGAPWGGDALYLTEGTTVYGVTMAATGMAQLWVTFARATPNWVLQ